MFDQSTSDLIRNTPPLEGLDRDNLPDQLTKAFAHIAAARVRMRNLDDDISENIEAIVAPIRRLAYTNEALVGVLPEREDRRSAAFVAATAHQLSLNADYHLSNQPLTPCLEPYAISSDIASVLLFLIAESTADASEMARSVIFSGLAPIEQSIVSSICDLASGKLVNLLNRKPPGLDDRLSGNLEEHVSSTLYLELLLGIRKLAEEILKGERDNKSESSLSVFRKVKKISLGEALPIENFGSAYTTSFSGPHHLASLLLATASDLFDSAITNIDAPPGVDPKEWLESMRFFSRSRPYLWKNHRGAIDKGYLSPGISAAIAFPTGAGKSALAELKINVSILRDEDIIFLCPTHALVEQTVNSLKTSFPNVSIQGERQDSFGIDSVAEWQSEIFVMTPEACLAQLSIDPYLFQNVGLLVFDECHLLHPTENPNDRRAIDAMLCLINLPLISANIDILLLSAMMKNTKDISEWISELLSRPCLALSLSWKPTRQLRGSVVYQQKEVNTLNDNLNDSRTAHATKAPSTKDKRALIANPYALFSLKQTWITRQAKDYALVRLLNKKVQLSANNRWQITPNSGTVSSYITTSSVLAGIRTLVFFQTIKNAASAARSISKELDQPPVKLTNFERRQAEIAILEIGGNSHMYAQIRDGRLIDSALAHHGLLLPEERALCESLYKRADGIKALTATSTLAQGMNLPSELVIIAEDSRFDSATERREILEARELLNAAGRAGRAGQSASGVVLVIPGKVIGIDLKDQKIGQYWSSLREIFGQSDQCLEIDDPLTAILDRIHADTGRVTSNDQYAITRLAKGEDPTSQAESLSRALNGSFAAHMAKKRNDTKWIEDRIQSSIQLYRKHAKEMEEDSLSQQIAASLGLTAEVVICLMSSLDKESHRIKNSIPAWRRWFFTWLQRNPDMLEHIFRTSSLSELFGKQYTNLTSAEEKAELAVPVLRKLVWLWMQGQPLSKLELVLVKDKKKLKQCIGARRFVIRIIPELSFLFGFPALLHERRQVLNNTDTEMPAAPAQLRYCLRHGYNSLEKSALSQLLRSEQLSRREVHSRYQEIRPFIDTAIPGENWDQVMDRVSNALDARLQSEF